jgi:DNA repair protein RadA/Sms
LFEMTGTGLAGVEDAGGLFLIDRRGGTPGSVVFPAMEGQRPLLVEVQALILETSLPSPRRSATGFDGGRLALLLAVLERRAGLAFGRYDVYISAVGGVRIADPGADLAVCMALVSAFRGQAVAEDMVVLGEVGLGGEVRQVAQTPRRLAEAARFGFAEAVVPDRGPAEAPLQLRLVSSLAHAVERSLGPDPAWLQLAASSARKPSVAFPGGDSDVVR